MAGSVILYPLSIMKKASDMNSKLESVELVISDVQKDYSTMENEEKLKGEAWSSVKGYIRDIQQPYLLAYKAWKNEHKEALELYSSAGSSLPSVQKLDKSQMENTITRSENIIQRQRNREHPNYNVIYFYEDLINELREKIDAMDTFIAAISGIFDSADNMHKVLANASTELNKVKLSEKGDSIEYTELMSNAWICSMVVIAGMYGISQDGIKEDELAWLYEIGLTDNDIGIAYIRSKAQGDGDFIVNFIRKDYNAAFASIEGDKAIGESSSMFVIKYFSGVSMLERKLDENLKSVQGQINPDDMSYLENLRIMRIRELEGFTNAVLGLKDPEKVIDNFNMIQNAAEVYMTNIFFAALNSKVEIGEKECREICTKYADVAALGALFGSNATVMNEHTSYLNNVNLKEAAIKNLVFDESTKTYHYDISYKGYGIVEVDGRTVTTMDIDLEDTIYTRMLDNNTDLRDTIEDLELSELYKKREALFWDSLNNWTMDMGTIWLNSQVPFLGAAVEFTTSDTFNDRYSAGGDMIKESPLGDIEEFGEIAESGALDAFTSTVDSAMQFMSDKEDIESSIQKLRDKKEIGWFSTGSGFYYGKEGMEKMKVISYGRFDPKRAIALSKWEKDGLQKIVAPGYDTVEKTKKDAFLALLGDSDSTEYKIFFGGADISEMDIEELDSKVRKIGMLYDDKILTETSGFSAKDQFYQYIQEQN
jgi:hypothetical protein